MRSNRSPLVIDCFAWVEYFRGSRLGRVVQRHTQSRECFTPTIVLGELAHMYVVEGIATLSTDLDEIESLTPLVTMSRQIAEEAGKVKALARKTKQDFPLSDGIVYATAVSMRGEVLSPDPHFEGMRGIIFLE